MKTWRGTVAYLGTTTAINGKKKILLTRDNFDPNQTLTCCANAVYLAHPNKLGTVIGFIDGIHHWTDQHGDGAITGVTLHGGLKLHTITQKDPALARVLRTGGWVPSRLMVRGPMPDTGGYEVDGLMVRHPDTTELDSDSERTPQTRVRVDDPCPTWWDRVRGWGRTHP